MYDLEETVEFARQLIANKPNTINPSGIGGSCLYTAADDPTHHCIAGEMLNVLNLPAPGPEIEASVFALPDEYDIRVFDQNFDRKARIFLSRLQDQADGNSNFGNPIEWRHIDIDAILVEMENE